MIDIQKVFGGKYPMEAPAAEAAGFSTIDLARQLSGLGGYQEETPEWQTEMQRYLPWYGGGGQTPAALPTPTPPTPTAPTAPTLAAPAPMLAPGAPPGTQDVFTQPGTPSVWSGASASDGGAGQPGTPYSPEDWQYEYLIPEAIGKPREQTARYWMDLGGEKPWQTQGMDIDQWYAAGSPLPGAGGGGGGQPGGGGDGLSNTPYSPSDWEWEFLIESERGKPRIQTARYWMDKVPKAERPWIVLGMGIEQWQAAGSPLPGGPGEQPPTPPAPPGVPTPPTPTPQPPIPPYNPPDVPIPETPGWDLPPAEEGAPATIEGTYPPEEPPFPYPSQWGTASNVMQQFAEGMPTQLPEFWQKGAEAALGMAQGERVTPVPSEWEEATQRARNLADIGITPTPTPQAWTTAQQGAQQMLEGGQPVDISGWWEAQQPVFERKIREQAQQAAEEAGLTGLRWSTPLQRNITDIAGRESAALWADLAGRDIAAQEAARARQVSAVPQLTQLGAGEAGLGEAARQRLQQAQLAATSTLQDVGMGRAGLQEAAQQRAAQAIPNLFQYAQLPTQLTEAAKTRGLQAAGGLMDVGQQYAQLPMQTAQQTMNMATQLQQMQQGTLASIYQEFLRRLPESSPFWGLGMQATAMPFQSVPEMYQPSALSQLFNIGAQGLGTYAALK